MDGHVTRFYHKKCDNNRLIEDFAKLSGPMKTTKDGSKVKFLESGYIAIMRLGSDTIDGVLEIRSASFADKHRVKVKYLK